MVTLLVDSANLELALSPTERAAAFQRENIRVARADILKVQLTDDPWTWVRGVRKPGTQVSGVFAAGTWHSIAGTDFVMIRGRRPGVVIDLGPDAAYQRLLLTTRHGLALVEALNLDDIDAKDSVVELAETAAVPVQKPARVRKPRTATA